MKRFAKCIMFGSLFYAAAPAAAVEPKEAADRLSSLEGLYGDPSVIGTSPEPSSWSQDGERLLFLWNDDGSELRDVWLWDSVSGQRSRITRFADSAKQVGQALWLSDDRIAMIVDGDLMIAGTDGQILAAYPVPGAITLLERSPCASRMAFVAGSDLWIVDGQGAPHALVSTDDGVEIERFRWSPDGRSMAFVAADRRKSRAVEISVDEKGETERFTVARPFPGDDFNIGYKLGHVSVDTGKVQFFDRADEQDPIWSFAISGDDRLVVSDSSDLSIKTHSIDAFTVGTNAQKLVYRNTDPTQIRPDWQTEWDGQGGLFALLDDDGYNHLYHIRAPGAHPTQITSGNWEIDRFEVDTASRQLFFRANRDGFARRDWYSVPFEGGPVHAITKRAGTHDLLFTPAHEGFADRFSDDSNPPDLFAGATQESGARIRITNSPLAAFRNHAWAEVRYVDYRSHVDGAALTARVMLPANFDPGRRYPLIVGSVYSDAVRNQWGGRNAHPTWGLDQQFAASGYIVVNPAIRGSFGRGSTWNRPMLHQYGGLDIDDIQDGARHLVDLGWADPDRIGIWGSSYGGLMTLMSLFRKPGFYAAGVAGAPASNVAHAYPEQQWIMGPADGEDHDERYRRQSALYQSQGLNDPLMIIHGTRDEVVLYRDTMALADRMIAQQKDFQLVTLPGVGHGWDAEKPEDRLFAYRQLFDFFERHIGDKRD